MVLGVLLLRDSGFDHFGDAAGGKRESEDYRQVFHGSVFSPGRGGKSNDAGASTTESRQKENLHLTAKQRHPPAACLSGQC
jgi:hypothetical protein